MIDMRESFEHLLESVIEEEAIERTLDSDDDSVDKIVLQDDEESSKSKKRKLSVDTDDVNEDVDDYLDGAYTDEELDEVNDNGLGDQVDNALELEDPNELETMIKDMRNTEDSVSDEEEADIKNIESDVEDTENIIDKLDEGIYVESDLEYLI